MAVLGFVSACGTALSGQYMARVAHHPYSRSRRLPSPMPSWLLGYQQPLRRLVLRVPLGRLGRLDQHPASL